MRPSTPDQQHRGDECPVKAIFPEEDLPEEWQNYMEINARYYESESADRGSG